MMTLPGAVVAYARAVKTSRRKVWRWELLVDQCPICQLKHAHHGGSGPEPSYGLFWSTCANRAVRTAYELRPAGGAR